jgi:hypothetical protein
MRVIHLLPIVPMSIRTYAAQLIMVHSVARHLGNSDEQAQEEFRLPAIASSVRETRHTASA